MSKPLFNKDDFIAKALQNQDNFLAITMDFYKLLDFNTKLLTRLRDDYPDIYDEIFDKVQAVIADKQKQIDEYVEKKENKSKNIIQTL